MKLFSSRLTNISQIMFDHRTADQCDGFSYDNLDRLTIAQYGVDDTNEIFTMDDLGNRDNVNMHDDSDVNYVIDVNTNRFMPFINNCMIHLG